MKFQISAENLLHLIQKYQFRSYTEQIDYLQKQYETQEFIIQKLMTCHKDGIQNICQARKSVYGENISRKKKLSTFFQLYLQGFHDNPIRVMILMSIIMIILQPLGISSIQMNWKLGLSIIITIQVCVLISSLNNYHKVQQFNFINQTFQQSKRMKIIRNGNLITIHPKEVLVGDICILQQNEIIQCDGLLLSQKNQQGLTVIQNINNEKKLVKKKSFSECIKIRNQLIQQIQKKKINKSRNIVPSPILLSGSRIINGKGKMVILSVGINLYINRYFYEEEKSELTATQLQSKVIQISTKLSMIGIVSACFMATFMLIRFFIEKLSIHKWQSSQDLSRIFQIILLASCILILSIPEGLPLSVTISLAYSLRRILQDNNLVRRIQACETMGLITNICIDKQKIFVEDDLKINFLFSFQLEGIQQLSSLKKIAKYSTNYINILITCLINCTEQNTLQSKAYQNFMKKLNWNENNKIQLHGEKKQCKKQNQKLIQKIFKDGKNFFIAKGSTPKILELCNYVYEDGNVFPINSIYKQDILKATKQIQKNGEKVTMFAYDDGRGYIFLALLGLKSTLKQNIIQNLQILKKSKIKLHIITNDNYEITSSFLEQIGFSHLLQVPLATIDAKKFYQQIGGLICKKCQIKRCRCPYDLNIANNNNMEQRIDTIANKERFLKIAENLTVIYNCNTQQKYAFIVGLHEMKKIVAVTCSSFQEKLILQRADVGFIMKDCFNADISDFGSINMLNNNLQTLIKSILWGRNIIYSIKKYLTFHLTANSVIILLTLYSGIFWQQGIIKPIQLIWINLIIDNLAAVALATQPPTEQLFQKNFQEDLINKKMIKKIIIIGLYQFLILGVIYTFGQFFIPEFRDSYDSYLHSLKRDPFNYKYNLNLKPNLFIRSGRKFYINGDLDYLLVEKTLNLPSRHLTFVFNLYVILQIFNFFSCRKIDNQKNIFSGLQSNKWFLIVILFIIVSQIILMTFAKNFFLVYNFLGLHPYHWLICLLIGIIQFFISIFINISPQILQQQEIKAQKKKEKVLPNEFGLKGRIHTILHRDLASI